jgi:hypothetical protein
MNYRMKNTVMIAAKRTSLLMLNVQLISLNRTKRLSRLERVVLCPRPRQNSFGTTVLQLAPVLCPRAVKNKARTALFMYVEYAFKSSILLVK